MLLSGIAGAAENRWLHGAKLLVQDQYGNKKQICSLKDADGQPQTFTFTASAYDNFGNPIALNEVDWTWKLVSYDDETGDFGETELQWPGVTLTDTRDATGTSTAQLRIEPDAQGGCVAAKVLFSRREDSTLSTHSHYSAKFKPIWIQGLDSTPDPTSFTFDGASRLAAPTSEDGASRFYYNTYYMDQYHCAGKYVPADWTMTDADGGDVLSDPSSGISRCTTGFWDGCFVVDLSPSVQEGTYTITATDQATSRQASKTVTVTKEPRFVWGVNMKCTGVNYQNSCWSVPSPAAGESRLTITAFAEDQYGQPIEVEPENGFFWGLTDAFDNVDGVHFQTQLNGVSIERSQEDPSVATVTIPANTETEVWVYAGVRRDRDFIRYPYLMKISPAGGIELETTLKDHAGNPLTADRLAHTQGIRFTAVNNTGKAQQCAFIAAFYDAAGKFLCSGETAADLSKGNSDLLMPIQTSPPAASSIRIFALDTAYRPLCKELWYLIP